MANPRREFEREAKRILRHILVDGALPTLDDFGKGCLLFCEQKQYVISAKVRRLSKDKVIYDKIIFRVTEPGLQWLYPKWDKKFIVSTTIAIISVVCNILQFIFR